MNVGDRGYDSSGTILSVADLLARGAKFVFRYLSGSPGGWKDWSAGELGAYTAAGLAVGAYWETGATRMLEGFGAGVADAQAAAAEEGNLGHRFDRIVFADDENNDGANGQKMAYCDGLASVLPDRFEVYGSGGLLVAVAQRHGRTHGVHVSSWGNDGGNAGVRQEANYHSLPGSDDLTLLKADMFSGGGSGPAPIDNRKEVDMYLLETDEPTPKGYRIYPLAKVIAVRTSVDDIPGHPLTSEYVGPASWGIAHGEKVPVLVFLREVIRGLEAQGRPTDQASILSAIKDTL